MDIRSLPSSSAIKAFVSVARGGSFHKAAIALSITPSAVSHQIASLEQSLGTRLFDRSGRKVKFTESGQYLFNQLFPHILGILESTNRFPIQNKDNTAVTVCCAPSFAAKILVPRLGELKKAKPEIRLRIEAANRYESEVLPSDIDIVYGFKPNPERDIEQLMSEKILPLCSPGFLKRFLGKGKRCMHPHDLLELPLIVSENTLPWSTWYEGVGLNRIQPSASLSFDLAEFSIIAAAKGLGVALQSSVLAHEELSTGQLVPACQPKYALHLSNYFISMEKRRRRSGNVRTVFDWVRSLSADIVENNDQLLLQFQTRR